jgi:1-acyl-sn-glycerol-3-phosphate acyltransferase
VATITPRSDRIQIETRVLATIRNFLAESGNGAAIEALKGTSNLERDLGLGSVERVELLARFQKILGTSISEGVVADAKTVDDIIGAIAGPLAGEGARAISEAPGDSLPQSLVGSQMRQAASEPPVRDIAGAGSGYGGARRLWRAVETAYGVYSATVFFVWLVVTWLIVLIMPSGQQAAGITSGALRLYFRLIGCRIQVEGEKHADAHGACIYVSNHTSYSDVLIVMALLKTNYHFVAKSEINNMPFIGTFLRKLGHFAFERNKLRARSRQADEMEKALLRGESLFVFAEGTFTAQPGVRPFQLGAFRAAVKTGRPIIPVALKGARRFLRDGSFLPRPSQIAVTFCSPIVPAPLEGREWAEVLRLRDEARRIISSHSGEPLLHSSQS